jgi:hypothetical protein
MAELTRVAAVQMRGRVADIDRNIAHVGDLAEQALRAGAHTRTSCGRPMYRAQHPLPGALAKATRAWRTT